MKKFGLSICLALAMVHLAGAQQKKFTKHENVVYGMISGMALIMDVYVPEGGNNIGILCIPGSGFGYFNRYQRVYNQPPLKDDYALDISYGSKWMQGLVNQGYTVFVINHRFSPRFKFPDAMEDCRRAVRFIRYNARKYKINPDKIGAIGQSSGGYFSAMLGLNDSVFENVNKNPVDSVSSKVQAVIAMAAPFNLTDFNPKADTTITYNTNLRILLAYMGELPNTEKSDFVLTGKYAEASPITHVSKNDAPVYIVYSDNDPFFPIRQGLNMHKKLLEAGVETKISIIPKSGHEPMPDMNEVDNWFKRFLK